MTTEEDYRSYIGASLSSVLFFLSGFVGEQAALGILLLSLALSLITRGFTPIGMAYGAFLAVRRIFGIRPAPPKEMLSFEEYLLRFSPSAMIGLIFFAVPTVATRAMGILWCLSPLLIWIADRRRRTRSLCAEDRRDFFIYARDAWEGLSEADPETGLLPEGRADFPTPYEEPIVRPETAALTLLAALCARDLGFIDTKALCERCRKGVGRISSFYLWNGCPLSAYDRRTLAPAEDLVSTRACGIFFCALTALCEGLREYVREEASLSSVIDTLTALLENAELSPLFDAAAGYFHTGYHVSRGVFAEGHHTDADGALAAAYFAHARNGTPFPAFQKTGRHEDTLLCALFLPMEHALRAPSLCRAVLCEGFFVRGKRLFGKGRCAAFAFDSDMRYAEACNGDRVIAPHVSFLLAPYAPERAAKNLRRLRTLGAYGRFGFSDALDGESARVGAGYACVPYYGTMRAAVSLCAAAALFSQGVRPRFLRAAEMRAFRYVLFRPLTIPRFERKQPSRIRGAAPKTDVPTETAYPLTHPEAALLTNHKTKLFASSSGHLHLVNGKPLEALPLLSPYAPGDGIRAEILADGLRLPTAPLGERNDSPRASFSFAPLRDAVVYRSHHTGHGKEYTVTLTLRVLPDREIAALSVRITGASAAEARITLPRALCTGEPMRTQNALLFCAKEAFGILAEGASMNQNELRLPIKPNEETTVLLGFAADEELLCDALTEAKREKPRTRRQKYGALADLQYAHAGLYRPIGYAERYLLRAFLFGNIRPRTETSRRFDSRALARFDLSPRTPLVLATNARQRHEERLRELFGLFRYARIRGVRFDLVILCPSGADEAFVRAMIAEALLDGLCIGAWNEGTLSPDERLALDVTASAVWDLRLSLAENCPDGCHALPACNRLMTRALPEPPQGSAHVIAHGIFGTALSEHTLGYTYARDARLGRLTPENTVGERLFLRVYKERGYEDHDLCAQARKTEFGLGCAVYTGECGGVLFRLAVTLTERLGIKALSLTLSPTPPCKNEQDLSVLYAVRPALGETPAAARGYRFRRERNGLSVTRLLQNETGVSELLLLSPDRVTALTEEAALLSDGKVFRGEADMAVLCRKIRLTKTETIRFCLAPALSRAHGEMIRRFCETELSFPGGNALGCDSRAWERRLLYGKLGELFLAPRAADECVPSHILAEALALLPATPYALKLSLLLIASHQYEEGDLQARWYAESGVRTADLRETARFLNAVSRYLTQTGDTSLLNAPVPYLTSAPLTPHESNRHEKPSKTKRVPLREHIARAKRLLQESGQCPHPSARLS